MGPGEHKRHRAAATCNYCRARKIKCSRSQDGPCRKCQSAGRECITTQTKGARPYYQTSKEQFELMSTIIRHCVPNINVDMDPRELRAAVSKLESVIPHREGFAMGQDSPPEASQTRAFPISSPLPTQAEAQVNRGVNSVEAIPLPAFSPRSYSHGVPSVPMMMELNYDPQTHKNNKSEDTIYLDDMGSFRYDNGTGWGSFFRQLQAEEFSPTLSPQAREECSYGFWDCRPSQAAISDDFPSQSRVHDAAIKFFTEVNSVAYLLSYDWFFSAITDYYSERPSRCVSIRTIILAVVALVEKSESIFRLACQFLEPLMSERSVESVQAITLIVLYRLNRESRYSAWILLGCAIRMARSLGLNRPSLSRSRVGDCSAELQWRLWRSLCDMDMDLALALGQFPDSYERCDENLVNSIFKDMTPSPNTPPGYLSASAKLSDIAYDILAHFRQDNVDQDLQLSQLDNWLEGLVPHLRLDVPCAPAYIRAICFLHLRYHQYVILLTRTSFLSQGSTAEYAMWCDQSTRSSLKILQDLEKLDALSDIYYQDFMFVLSTGMMLFFKAAQNRTHETMADLEHYATSLLPAAQHHSIGRRAARVTAMVLKENAFDHDKQDTTERMDAIWDGDEIGLNFIEPDFWDL